jgi:hypothetical protein
MSEYQSHGHIESDESEPTVAGHKLSPGKKYEVKMVEVKEGQLGMRSTGGSRLCGGTNTCLALTEV